MVIQIGQELETVLNEHARQQGVSAEDLALATLQDRGSSGFRCKLDGRPRWSPAFRRNRPGNAA